MNEIGAILKQRREELGFSLEDMSLKTKISVNNLEAIENGNIEYFKDDISYVRYFVRFYCQALQVDYDSVRDELAKSIDGYTETCALKKIQENEMIQENIKKRIQNNGSTPVRIKRKKIDYSLLTLIIVISIMIIVLVYSAFNFLPNLFRNNNNETTPTPIVVVTPTPTTTTAPTEDAIVKSDLVVTSENSTNYTISGFKPNEQVSFVVTYGAVTWSRVLINDVVTDNPPTNTYQPNETMEVLVNATNDLKVTIHLGIVDGNVIEINGQKVELDSTISSLKRGQQIHFTFKGE